MRDATSTEVVAVANISEMPARSAYDSVAAALSSIDVAFCLFDKEDRAILWNAAFLKFFPEHDGHVYRGEPYRENLYRFYRGRLAPAEQKNIERYVDEGIERHRSQTRPFVFSHLGRRLHVASAPTPGGGRVRIWRELSKSSVTVAANPKLDEFPIDLLEYIADGAMILDQADRIIATNNEFRVLYDVEPGQALVGLTLVDIIRQSWVKAGSPEHEIESGILDNMRFVGAPFEVELPGGRWRRVIARRNARGIGYFTHSDITLLKRALADLSIVAATDGLTGLLNRGRFEVVLNEEWQRCTRDGTPISLIFVDIDHFKTVNDSYSHLAGDECLRRVARIVEAATQRPLAVASRYGGDEFAVLLPNTDESGALLVGQSIHQAISTEPWREIHPHASSVTASIGIACVSDTGGAGLTDLVRLADEMLYLAKSEGRDRVQSRRLTG
jgi:diguanylate cyclase (GGDEF)-like protein